MTRLHKLRQLRLLSESTFPEQGIPQDMRYREPTVPGPSFTAKDREGKISLGTRLLHSLKANKAHGPDDISVNMIKLCGNTSCTPLRLIFNNIPATGIFPDQWKRANDTPVHKEDDKQLFKHYRPISLLLIFDKLFEKIVFMNPYNHLVGNHLITKKQSDFRSGDSVTNQLI